MLLTLMLVSVCSWQAAWAQEVAVEVTLPEANALSTELLKQVDDVKTITSLTIKTAAGKSLGEQDWTTLQSMTALQTLDMSQASATTIPDNQFSTSYANCKGLVTVTLPANLKTIGRSAFYDQDNLVTVNVPSTVTTIGYGAFSYCENLENCDLSGSSITAIPSSCFDCCYKLLSFTIPETVTSIGSSAFAYCYVFTSPLPSNQTEIGSSAFSGAAMTDVEVVIPEGMEIQSYIFRETGIKSITFPTTFYEYGGSCLYDCNNLTDITIKSPTVLEEDDLDPNNKSNITLHVPSYLVNAYKSHSDWNQYKNVVAITPHVTDYTVQANLDLNYAMRMEGTPSVTFAPDRESLSFKISGEANQAFNNFTASTRYSYGRLENSTMILSECPNVTISGDYMQRIKTGGSDWFFFCLPFDFKVGDIETEDGKFAIRTYDGAKRNTTDATNDNWTRLGADDVVTAGTGFIYQTSKETWSTFKALKGGTNNVFKTSANELTTALAANNSNASASAANTGWNMVGNPWQTYYNAHKINYTAPFCYYNMNGGTYEAVSIEDDDFALQPHQAIFVQCPSGISSIGFPASGRQLTDEITEQNGTRSAADPDRLLFDLQIAYGTDFKDKTRLVVNEKASLGYEIGRDASKFMSDGTQCPQIYSLDADGTQYAINERPADNGTLNIGVVFANDGDYTLSALRNGIGQVILTDNETGIQTNLQQNSYSFSAKKGISDKRFTLSYSRGFGGEGTTGIQDAKTTTCEQEVYTLDGQKLGNTTEGLKKGVYVIRQGQQTKKVIIK